MTVAAPGFPKGKQSEMTTVKIPSLDNEAYKITQCTKILFSWFHSAKSMKKDLPCGQQHFYHILLFEECIDLAHGFENINQSEP